MQRPVYATLHPRFGWMHDYLALVAPPGLLPGRQHVEPYVFKTLLPFVNLVDVLHEVAQLDFRYRLVGTMQTEIAGREITGLRLADAVVSELAPRIRHNMEQTVEQRIAFYDRFPVPHPSRDFIISERIYYPLAQNGVDVDMLLILNGYPELEDPKDANLPALPKAGKTGHGPPRHSPQRDHTR